MLFYLLDIPSEMKHDNFHFGKFPLFTCLKEHRLVDENASHSVKLLPKLASVLREVVLAVAEVVFADVTADGAWQNSYVKTPHTTKTMHKLAGSFTCVVANKNNLKVVNKNLVHDFLSIAALCMTMNTKQLPEKYPVSYFGHQEETDRHFEKLHHYGLRHY